MISQTHNAMKKGKIGFILSFTSRATRGPLGLGTWRLGGRPSRYWGHIMIDLYSRSESLLTRSPGSNNEVEVALSTSPGWRAREAGPSCSLPNIWKPCSYAGCSKVKRTIVRLQARRSLSFLCWNCWGPIKLLKLYKKNNYPGTAKIIFHDVKIIIRIVEIGYL